MTQQCSCLEESEPETVNSHLLHLQHSGSHETLIWDSPTAYSSLIPCISSLSIAFSLSLSHSPLCFSLSPLLSLFLSYSILLFVSLPASCSSSLFLTLPTSNLPLFLSHFYLSLLSPYSLLSSPLSLSSHSFPLLEQEGSVSSNTLTRHKQSS